MRPSLRIIVAASCLFFTAATAQILLERSSLESTLDKILTAMLHHSPPNIPLSPNTQYSENNRILPIGSGLWQTLSHYAKPTIDPYAALFADPSANTTLYWGLIRTDNTPAVFALRVTLSGENNTISSISATFVSADKSSQSGLPVPWDGHDLGVLNSTFQSNTTELIPPTLVTHYFDSLQDRTIVDVCFTTHCIRRDNARQINETCGVQAFGDGEFPNGLDAGVLAWRERRVLVQDKRVGVAIVSAVVNGLGKGAGDYRVMALLKARNEAVDRVESFIARVPS